MTRTNSVYGVLTIARRDLLDLSRYRRLWLFLFMQPLLFAPVLLMLPLFISQSETSKLFSQKPVVYVQGSAPHLTEALKERGMVLRRTSNTTRAVLQNRSAGLILSPALDRAFRLGQATHVNILVYGTRSNSVFHSFALRENLISMWGRSRTDSGAGPPTDTGEVTVAMRDVTTSAIAGRRFLASTVPLYLWFPFSMMMFFAASTITAEKDARTFEGVLALPYSRQTLTIAKFVVGLIGAATLLAVTLVPVPIVKWLPFDFGQAQLYLDATSIGVITVAGVGITIFAVCVGLVVGTYARSTRESSSILSLISLPFAGLAISLLFGSDIAATRVLEPVPVLGLLVVAREVLERGDSVFRLVPIVLWNALYALFLLLATWRLMAKEQGILRGQG